MPREELIEQMQFIGAYPILQHSDYEQDIAFDIDDVIELVSDYEKQLRVLSSLMKSGESRGVKKATEDFESRTCESCEHYQSKSSTCNKILDWQRIPRHYFVNKDFGYNKFGRKTND